MAIRPRFDYRVDIPDSRTIIGRGMKAILLLLTFLVLASVTAARSAQPTREESRFAQARQNALAANEAFSRCHRYVDGWLAHCDPQTGLFPRNLGLTNCWSG